MANYRKSFNFRNGVQVDNDNFVVTGSGLVGIGTSLPQNHILDVYGDTRISGLATVGSLSVSETVKVGSGITMDSTSGIISATTFYGDGSNLTGITIESASISSYADSAGIATALENSRNFSVSGDVLSHTVSFDGTGNVALGVTLSSDFSANTSGIITSTGGFYGDLTGVASTATKLQNSRNFSVSGDVATSAAVGFAGIDDVDLVVTLSSDFSANTSGIITASTLDSTNLTTGSIEVESENSTIEVIGSNSAYISIGFTSPTVGIGSTYASLSFSGTDLSIRNYDIGSINSYLQVGGPGLTTGRFNWYDGDTNTLLMALTHEGKLGIGIDNPTETFEVVGTSTVTTDSYVGNDLFVGNDLNVTGSITGNFTLQDPITSKVNATGVSTFSSINIFGSGLNQLGIGTDDPQTDIDATGKVARFGSVAISTDNAIYNVDVGGGVRATDGFLSYGPNPVQIGIQTVGEGVGLSTYLVFTVVGIGSTSFLLS